MSTAKGFLFFCAKGPLIRLIMTVAENRKGLHF